MEPKKIDDIYKDIKKQNKNKMKKEVSQDIVDIFEKTADGVEDYFKRKKIQKDIRKTKRVKFISKTPLYWKILKLLGVISLFVLILNIFLGNVLLLKTIIKFLFIF